MVENNINNENTQVAMATNFGRRPGEPISNAQFTENPQNKQTLNNLNMAGDKIKNAQLGEAFVGAARKVGGAAGTVAKSVGAFLKPSSGKVQGLVSKIPTVGARQSSFGSNVGQTQLTGGLILQSLQRTPDRIAGQKGRPQTKVVIKKRGLLGIGGTQSDFEKLITLENMSKGKLPGNIGRPIGGSPGQVPVGATPQRQSLGFTSNISDFTGSGVQPGKTQQLREFANIRLGGEAEQLRQFTQPQTQRQMDTAKINMFIGNARGSGLSRNAQDKLRRFL